MYRAADLLKEVLARAGIDPQSPQAQIYRLWDELLGADLAGSAWLRDIRRGRLEVEVDHPARLQLVRMRQREILRRVRRRFPELAVTGLHVVVGSPVALTGADLNPYTRTTERHRRQPDSRTS